MDAGAGATEPTAQDGGPAFAPAVAFVKRVGVGRGSPGRKHSAVRTQANAIAQRARFASPRVRFWQRVDVKALNECWPWLGGRTPNGYGSTRMYGASRRFSLGAHRAAWIYANGPIPDGQLICHSCDNPPCCNPGHLFLGTPKDNLDDMRRKRRERFVRGEEQGQSRLTRAQVPEIRRRVADGETQRRVAADYAVSQSRISRIVNREQWAWL